MKLRELFADPRAWTIGVCARDAHGFECDIENGASFCLLGGIAKCYLLTDRDLIFEKIYSKISKGSITGWNDSHGYEEVLELCKELDI